MIDLPQRPSLSELKTFIADSQLEFATVSFVDYQGTVRGKYVSRAKLEGALDGMAFPLVSLALDPTDVILLAPVVADPASGFPDHPVRLLPETARLLPWAPPGRNLLLLSQFAGPGGELCPRNILCNAAARAADAGFIPCFSTELEFTVFDETPHSVLAKGHRNLTRMTPLKTYYSLVRQETQSEFYNALMDMCASMRIPVESLHQEMGAGFMEVAMRHGTDVGVADASALFKTFAKVVAQRHGKLATFMARWSQDADGQSGHIHISLQHADGSSAFHDATRPHGIGSTMRHFIGGLQLLMGDFCLMFAPNINSFKRFVPGIFAPVSAAWGIENRTCGIRAIPGSAKSIRLECRTPGADANPYLSLAAVLTAGLHGVQHALEPTSPFEGSAYDMDIDPALKLPGSFAEAIDRFRRSPLARGYFGNDFVEAYAGTRQTQHDQFAAMVTDRELERFFELV